MNKRQKQLTNTLTIIFGLVLALPLTSIGGYLVMWQYFTPTVHTIDGLIIENTGLNEDGIIYFDVADYRSDGRPFTTQNFYASVDTSTGELIAHTVAGQIQQHEPQLFGYTSYYETSPLHVWGLQNQFGWAGIPIATGGFIVVRDENNRLIDRVNDPAGIDLHEFVITPEGNYIYMIADIIPMWRDATLTCLPSCQMLSQAIVEVTPDGEQLYNYPLMAYYDRDDFVMDDMLTMGNLNLYDLTHANSVRLTPDNNLIVSVRHANEVLVISRETGDLVWRSREYSFTNDTGFSHQHDSQILSNGNLLLFDNGNETNITRAVEYAINHDTRELTLVWQHSNDHWQPNRGSVRKTETGNYLINWVERDSGDIEIVSPDGMVLFSITIPEPYASYRAGWRAR